MRRFVAALMALHGAIGGAGASEVVFTPQSFGERPSEVREHQLPMPALAEAKLPVPSLTPKGEGGALSATGLGSLMRLKEVAPEMRERTHGLLTSLNATEKDGDIHISLPGDVLFDFDKSDIRADARPVLAKLIDVLKAYPDAPVTIEGHTDAKGGDDYNLALSDRRAASVKTYLGRSGAKADRFTTKGFGEAKPVASNIKANGSDDPAGRQKNRRVEFVIGQQSR